MVCGRSIIDLALLKRHTTLDSKIDVEAQYIRNFWKVLETFSQEDLKKFIQFTYAQRRLPSSDEEWRLSRTAHMRIMPAKLPKSLSDARKQRYGQLGFRLSNTLIFFLFVPSKYFS